MIVNQAENQLSMYKYSLSQIFTLKESKNSRISAAVPMKTKRSCANWSRVKSPFGSIHRPIMRINIRACSISITNVSVSTGIVGIFPKSNGIWKKIMVNRKLSDKYLSHANQWYRVRASSKKCHRILSKFICREDPRSV